MKKIGLIFIIILALSVGGFFFYQNNRPAHANDVTETSQTQEETTQQDIDLFYYEEDSDTFSLEHALSPRYIGSLDAPVVFRDFSSLSCPHCATFHNDILPKIKKNFIETGDVRIIFELMPLNQAALMGEQLVRCIPKKDFYKTTTLLYKTQEQWAFSKAPRDALIDLAKLSGISEEKAKTCLDNSELEVALTEKARDNAVNNDIKSTPTFIFENGERTLRGAGDYETYADLLTYLIKQQKNAPKGRRY